MPDYLRRDSRIETIQAIINPFKVQFDKVIDFCQDGYGDDWDQIYADDAEHLVGTVFIILQNYINSSITDLYPELTKLHLKYSLDKKVSENSNTTRIELIIALANFYKHRDLPTELHQPTRNTLEDLNLKYKEIYDLENNKYPHIVGSRSPIFNGLGMLSEHWELSGLIEIVSEWRENLWIGESDNHEREINKQ